MGRWLDIRSPWYWSDLVEWAGHARVQRVESNYYQGKQYDNDEPVESWAFRFVFYLNAIISSEFTVINCAALGDIPPHCLRLR